MKRVRNFTKKLFSPSYSKLNQKAFALVGGILLGVLTLLTTLSTYLLGLLPSYTGILIDIYGSLAYSATPGGALLGTIYSFITGFIMAYIFAWFYNRFL